MTDFDLRIAISELGSEMKHIMEKLDRIESRMTKFEATHDKVLVLQSKVESLQKEVTRNEKDIKLRASGVSGGVAAIVVAIIELVRYFF